MEPAQWGRGSIKMTGMSVCVRVMKEAEQGDVRVSHGGGPSVASGWGRLLLEWDRDLIRVTAWEGGSEGRLRSQSDQV